MATLTPPYLEAEAERRGRRLQRLEQRLALRAAQFPDALQPGVPQHKAARHLRARVGRVGAVTNTSGKCYARSVV